MLHVLSKRQRRALRMLDSRSNFLQKPYVREAPLPKHQNDANTTEMLGFISKLVQGPYQTRDSRGIFFFDALNIYFLIPTGFFLIPHPRKAVFLLHQGIARDSQRATDPQGKGRKEEKNSVYIYIASLRVEGIERGKTEKQVFF